MKVVGAVVLAVVVVGAIVVGGWQLGWWVKSYSVSRNAQIYQQGYGAQSAYIEDAHNKMAELASIDSQLADPSTPVSEQPALQAQKVAETRATCNEATLINPSLRPSDIATFVASNC